MNKSFVWGVATSSYQIEGAAYEDGKGLSIWDIYCTQPDKIFEGHSGDIACNHYHLYKEDISLMKQMGIKAYRFSISWPRVLPNGVGEVNQKGLQFYLNLVNELLEAGIEPYVTLFHWDLPYELHKKGGWLNSDSPKWFKEYTKVIVEAFGDKVTNYITFNEPQCFIGHGYSGGVHAPGLKHSTQDLLQMTHHILLSHGESVKTIRELAPYAKVGIATTALMHYPTSNTPEDIESARKAVMDEIFKSENAWPWSVSWWGDPIFLGKYPEEGLKYLEKYMPKIKDGDMEIISQPLDFLGQNIYNGYEITTSPNGEVEIVNREIGHGKTALNWPITPKSLYWGPKFLYERYKKPIFITENGLSCHDVVSLDGKVHDPNRIDFLHRYLKEFKKAGEDGVEIAGYFEWSFMDNFEWHSGYADRFGIVYVDFTTQERIIKDSGYWYKTVIETNGKNL
ncbi:beta-glucosidase [Candidatus Epulonipiscium fishelsonii]|uniref:Beta-glucosidase n=1 Tax=Candidatus Epulonipiscium fishelsonii TaxID=77094 RepID=A0ACC8XBI9_9FIRM|nr:beta-glucosidase [Epulopiscium sp. SCG-B05WGA-EpuloA1]ONI39856.1 beta-glucosidase [Epulopiscium sp. SCG-B11WGA-EpuloA1]